MIIRNAKLLCGAVVLAASCVGFTASSAQSLFLRADAGVSSTNEFDQSGTYGGGVGMNLPLGFRGDVTVSYRGGFEPADFLDSTGELPGTDLAADLPSVTTTSSFVGGYYDLPEPFPFLEPFVGGGVGITRVEPDDVVVSVPGFANSGVTLSQEASTNSSYFFTAGVALDFFKKAAIDVAYRYVDMGEVEYGGAIAVGDFTDAPTQSFDASSLTEELVSQEVMVSFRFTL